MARRFSIVIVHRNGAQMLLKALAALHAACDPARDEIFVVDNGSDDGSADEVARAWPGVQLIRNACNNGFARANNQAIAVASGEYVVLLNNDAFLAPDTLARFEAVFRSEPRCAVVAGQLLDADLGISHTSTARPLQAALASAATFSVGAALPLLVVLLVPGSNLVWAVAGSALLFLALLGSLVAAAGGAPVLAATLRVGFWGALAMAVTAGIGALFGVST